MPCTHDTAEASRGTAAQRKALKALYRRLGAPIDDYIGCVPCGVEKYTKHLRAAGLHPDGLQPKEVG